MFMLNMIFGLRKDLILCGEEFLLTVFDHSNINWCNAGCRKHFHFNFDLSALFLIFD